MFEQNWYLTYHDSYQTVSRDITVTSAQYLLQAARPYFPGNTEDEVSLTKVSNDFYFIEIDGDIRATIIRSADNALAEAKISAPGE